MVDENSFGREAITIVEIDQDFCSLSYGDSPCTAQVGDTGGGKCFNTLTTCQDTQNYTNSSLTLRFCEVSEHFPSVGESELYLPFVQSVSTNPTELNIASASSDLKALGKRASVTITMSDRPYNDVRVDKYVDERSYKPEERSTFWAKFLARNQFYVNRILRIRDGYIGQNVEDMRTRSYVIDRITGPDSNGRVKIVAKDILKLAEDKKAQAPEPSTGILTADIVETDTSFTISPAGIGDESYPASGKLIIGSEIMSFTRAADVFTLTRAQDNTEADQHDEGDAVQLCLVYSDERIENVIYDLLVNYGNIDASYIPLFDWQAEAEEWLQTAILNVVIVEPTGVTELIGELMLQIGFYIWWDDVNQQIPFRAVRFVQEQFIIDITEDEHIIKGSFQKTTKPDQRLSRIYVHYDQINPTESLDETSNYRKNYLAIVPEREEDEQFGSPVTRQVYARWLDGGNLADVITNSFRILVNLNIPPEYYQLVLDAKDRELDLADVARISHHTLVDFEGNPQPVNAQVISREEIKSGHQVRYTFQKFSFIGRFGRIMENSANDYLDATESELTNGAFISDNNGLMSDGSEGWKII